MLALLIALSAWPHLLAPWAQEQCTEIKMKGKEFFALSYFTCLTLMDVFWGMYCQQD